MAACAPTSPDSGIGPPGFSESSFGLLSPPGFSEVLLGMLRGIPGFSEVLSDALRGAPPYSAKDVQTGGLVYVGEKPEGVKSVDGILSGLRSGRHPPNLEVDSTAELQAVHEQLSRGGVSVESTYPGKMVELRDGTRVGSTLGEQVWWSDGRRLQARWQLHQSAPSCSMTTPLAREILKAGLDDWVALAAVDGFARSLNDGGEDERREWSLAAIRELVLKGLAELGEVSDGGFFAWEDAVDDALDRVGDMWTKADRNHWGFAVWLSNTAKGDEVARRI